MSYLKKMNFFKKKKIHKNGPDATHVGRQKNDEEINHLLDPSKLAASLNLKSSTIKFNYFFDDSDIFRVIISDGCNFWHRFKKKKFIQTVWSQGWNIKAFALWPFNTIFNLVFHLLESKRCECSFTILKIVQYLTFIAFIYYTSKIKLLNVWAGALSSSII